MTFLATLPREPEPLSVYVRASAWPYAAAIGVSDIECGFGAHELEIDILEVTDETGAEVPITSEERTALVTLAAKFLKE